MKTEAQADQISGLIRGKLFLKGVDMAWIMAILVGIVVLLSALLMRRRVPHGEANLFEPCSCQDLIAAISSKRGSKDSNCLTNLLYDEKIIAVEGVDELPPGCALDGASCFLGDRTYVVASLINKKTALRDLVKEGKKHHQRRPNDLGGVNWK